MTTENTQENTAGEATGNVTPNTEGKTKRTRVDMKTFIKVFEDANSIREVCDRTGLKPASVTQRATKYRKTYGIALKKMTGGGAKFDASEAKDFLAQLRAEKEAEQVEADAPAGE